MPGAGARGPVGRAHPISKNEKPSTSRDKDCKARARDEKARLSLSNSLTGRPLVHTITFIGFSEYSGFDVEEILKRSKLKSYVVFVFQRPFCNASIFRTIFKTSCPPHTEKYLVKWIFCRNIQNKIY